jgi:hypothetical protein
MTDQWLHHTVEVDINSVVDFFQRMTTVSNDFAKSLDEGVSPMLKGAKPAFGSGVVNEGALLRSLHERQRQAAMKMLNEVAMGLAALAKASAVVAAQYADGDVSSKASVDDVYQAFIPTPVPEGEQNTEVTATDAGPFSGSDTGDVVLPPYVPQPPDPSNGDVIGEGTSGEYTIGDDDEHMTDGVNDRPEPRA